MKRLKSERGFTLIELLIVLVILGLLTAIALIRYQDLTLEAQIGATKGNLTTIRGGIALLHAKFLLAGYGGTPQEYPTVLELNNNLTFGRTPALNGLKIVDGISNQGGISPLCVQCMPPDSVMSNNRLVVQVTTTQADSRIVSGSTGAGWDYDPASGQIYVAATKPNDSLGYAANLW